MLISLFRNNLNRSGKNTNIKAKHILCVLNYIFGNNLISLFRKQKRRKMGDSGRILIYILI